MYNAPRMTMPPPAAPCKDCTERHLNCHSECSRYKSFASERRDIHNKIYLENITQVKIGENEANKRYKAFKRRNKLK